MRKAVIRSLIDAFVADLTQRRFTEPRGWTPERRSQRILDIADAVERHFPSGIEPEAAKWLLDRVMNKLVDTMSFDRWPQPQEVLAALRACSSQDRAAEVGDGQELTQQTLDWFAEFVRRGQLPPSKYWGEGAARALVRQGAVTLDQIYETQWIMPPDLTIERLEAKQRRGDLGPADAERLRALRNMRNRRAA